MLSNIDSTHAAWSWRCGIKAGGGVDEKRSGFQHPWILHLGHCHFEDLSIPFEGIIGSKGFPRAARVVIESNAILLSIFILRIFSELFNGAYICSTIQQKYCNFCNSCNVFGLFPVNTVRNVRKLVSVNCLSIYSSFPGISQKLGLSFVLFFF